MDGRLFGYVPELDTPFLWVEDDSSSEAGHFNTLMRESRDRLLAGLRTDGGLVTFDGLTHMSFTDEPAYLTAIGRHLVGRLPMIGTGSRSVGDMTPMLADTITGFMDPHLDAPATAICSMRSPPTRAYGSPSSTRPHAERTRPQLNPG
jgi:hypothetical protein